MKPDPATILDKAGYDSLQELQDELKEHQDAYATASGGKKVLEKRDLDEIVGVLVQYNEALKASGGASSDQVKWCER